MDLFDGFPRGTTDKHSRHAPLGTAAWATTAPTWREGHIWIGRDSEHHPVGYRDDRHVVSVAGSRSGKGRSAIIPNLLLWPGSAVVIDPKGENATRTPRIRASRPGHRVAVIDPKRAADVPDDLRVSFNPLDLIDADDDDAIDLAAAIGDAVMVGSGDGKDIHWTESARQVFEAVLLHVAATRRGGDRSLVTVRSLLMKGAPERAKALTAEFGEEITPFDALWTDMRDCACGTEAVRDVIAGAAVSVCDMGENERGSVLSTARRNTKFIDSPWMRECLKGSASRAFEIDALKEEPGGATLYVCLPARFIATHARFLRLVLNLILFRMEAQGLEQPACGHPVLFILDEFAALSRMEMIEKAAGLMAGYGVKLWPILQDLGQLKRHYKESWETFLANTGMIQFFANADMTTLEWISKRLGQVELVRETKGASDSTTSGLSRSQSRTETSGWSQSSGASFGASEMADLSRVATRDGGSGLVPFIARAQAGTTAHNSGQSRQDGQSGGESVQTGDSASSGASKTETVNESIHQTPLLTPDEIARLFDRSTARQIVILDGRAHVLWRTNWDEDELLTPIHPCSRTAGGTMRG